MLEEGTCTIANWFDVINQCTYTQPKKLENSYYLNYKLEYFCGSKLRCEMGSEKENIYFYGTEDI